MPAPGYSGTVTPINYAITDSNGNSDSATIIITVTPVNDPPVLDLDVSNNTAANADYAGIFTENGGAVAIADADSLITDADDTNIESALITLTNPQTGDVLSALDGDAAWPAGVSAVVNGAGTQVTITGPATLAQYQDIIELIRFNNTSETPDTATRVITVTVNDGDATRTRQPRD